jgi:hypothetical protein
MFMGYAAVPQRVSSSWNAAPLHLPFRRQFSMIFLRNRGCWAGVLLFTLGEGSAMRAYGPGKGCGRLSLVMLLFLAGCGGGGGGGGGALQPLVYSGSTTQAAVTTGNASRLTANVMGGDDAAGVITGLSVQNSDATQARDDGLAYLTRRFGRDVRATVVRAKWGQPGPGPVSGVAVDETLPCTGGGTVRTFGTLDNFNGTGILTIVFSSCVEDGITMSGQGTVSVNGVDFSFNPPLPTDLTISFPRLTLRGGVNVDAGGSVRVELTPFVNTEIVTANLVQLDNNSGRMTMTQDLRFVNVYNDLFFPTSFTSSITGQVFDDVHGFVVITTPVNLVFSTVSQLFPDSGQLLLTGAQLGGVDRTILVRVVNSIMVQLELDIDGVVGVDNTARLKWTELTGPVGADLADTDGDGMHNSWETFYGLNPMVNDATADADGQDGDNVTEYQNGTNPNVGGS